MIRVSPTSNPLPHHKKPVHQLLCHQEPVQSFCYPGFSSPVIPLSRLQLNRLYIQQVIFNQSVEEIPSLGICNCMGTPNFSLTQSEV